MSTIKGFAERLVAWQQQYGRHHLPWQNHQGNPYPIWISEVMLQQTQVQTVIPYFERFMRRFPDVASLADAHQDEVLAHWSGLGYYSRARNLHQAARAIMQKHHGEYPETQEKWMQLAGIGRSTAAAICAFAFGQSLAILDGNVRRVLARHRGITGYTGLPAIQNQLWDIANSLLPAAPAIAPYTQGLMDLGSQLCTHSKPQCHACPLQTDCVAHLTAQTHALPHPKPKKSIPDKPLAFDLLYTSQHLLLAQRPNHGIWGGLWCLPDAQPCPNDYLIAPQNKTPLARLKHQLTHFTLWIDIQPIEGQSTQQLPASSPLFWLDWDKIATAPLPAPIKKTLLQYQKEAL